MVDVALANKSQRPAHVRRSCGICDVNRSNANPCKGQGQCCARKPES